MSTIEKLRKDKMLAMKNKDKVKIWSYFFDDEQYFIGTKRKEERFNR